MEVLVKYDGGTRFTATCGGYTVASGKGDDGDESKDGMWPAQLFAASIGMCIGGYVARYCEHHGIPYDDLAIELDRETAKGPSRTTKLEVRIKLPVALTEKQRDAIIQVAHRCHITNSIVHDMTVDVSLDSQSED